MDGIVNLTVIIPTIRSTLTCHGIPCIVTAASSVELLDATSMDELSEASTAVEPHVRDEVNRRAKDEVERLSRELVSNMAMMDEVRGIQRRLDEHSEQVLEKLAPFEDQLVVLEGHVDDIQVEVSEIEMEMNETANGDTGNHWRQLRDDKRCVDEEIDAVKDDGSLMALLIDDKRRIKEELKVITGSNIMKRYFEQKVRKRQLQRAGKRCKRLREKLNRKIHRLEKMSQRNHTMRLAHERDEEHLREEVCLIFRLGMDHKVLYIDNMYKRGGLMAELGSVLRRTSTDEQDALLGMADDTIASLYDIDGSSIAVVLRSML